MEEITTKAIAMLMNFLDSSVFGVIIGALIMWGAAGWRQKKQFAHDSQARQDQLAHDLKVRREQFSHEREQEIRGRRTEALADLNMLLEAQTTALKELWGFIKNPKEVRPHLTISPEDAWTVLRDRGYRIKLWSTEGPVTTAINEYATEIHMLLLYQSLGHPDVQALVEGKLKKLDEQRVTALDQQFQEASKTLAIALKETANLMSELNGIRVRKMTDQQVPVEEG